MSLKKYSTLADAIDMFSRSYPDKRTVTSAVNRYLLPAFGFKIAGSRMTKAEKEGSKTFATSIQLSHLNKNIILEYIESTFEKEQLSKEDRKFPRSHAKTFINFLEENKLIPIVSLLENNSSVKSNEEEKLFYLKSRVIDKTDIKCERKSRRQKITLSFDAQDYLVIEPSLDKNSIERELKRIKKEFENLEFFLKNERHCRSITAERTIQALEKLWGWLYQNKNLSIKDLNFYLLIGEVSPKKDIEDFEQINQYFIDRGQKELQQKKQAKYIKTLLQEYFIHRKIENSGTKETTVAAVTSLAKYCYKDITDVDNAMDYEDILLIRSLRIYQRNLPKRSKKMIDLRFTWEEVIKVRDRLKQEADIHNYTSLNNGGTIKFIKRPKTAIATSMQRFLILCFFTVIPPDRARTFRELEIGKTLKHGIRSSSGFTDVENLKDRSSAKYYINLKPEDYKTGDTYGEFWGELPNEVFEDGTTFYEYLNKWIYEGWRDVLLNGLKHNFMFCQSRKGGKIEYGKINYMVSSIFLSKTGIPMFPHRLRHIFCSYINELDISQKERDSIAFWMHHSPEMAKATYTHQDMEQKLQAGVELMRKIKPAALSVTGKTN